jgi:hypothetical protein
LEWLQAQISKGTRVFDLGRDLTRPPSTMYDAEAKFLSDSGFAQKFVRYVTVEGQVYKLYEWVKQ